MQTQEKTAVPILLHFRYSGDGNWQAKSKHSVYGDTQYWRISVEYDGTFSLGSSDSDLPLPPKGTIFFEYLEARKWANQMEYELRKLRRKEVAA